MKAIDLNLASSPFRNNTPYYLGYGVGALVLALFTVWNGWAFFAYARSQAALESDHEAKQARLDALYQEMGRYADLISTKDLNALNQKAVFTNALLDKRRFSWTELLNDLERVEPYQVRMLSIQPIIRPGGILIKTRAVAKDLKAFWNFQQNIQNHPKFRRVYPGGWLKMDMGEYVFNIDFDYFPEGAPMGAQGLTPEAAGETFAEAPGPEEETPEGSGEDRAGAGASGREAAAPDGSAPGPGAGGTASGASPAAGSGPAGGRGRRTPPGSSHAPAGGTGSRARNAGPNGSNDLDESAGGQPVIEVPGSVAAAPSGARPIPPREMPAPVDYNQMVPSNPSAPSDPAAGSPRPGGPQKPRWPGRGLPPGWKPGDPPPVPPEDKSGLPTIPVPAPNSSDPDSSAKSGGGGR